MRDKISVFLIDKDGDKNLEGLLDFISVKTFETEKDMFQDINSFTFPDVIITIGNEKDFTLLYDASFEVRKRWINFKTFEPKYINDYVLQVFIYNCNRDNGADKLFSIFTCSYKTTKEQFERLYNSLKAQTYKNWNWWILDDNEEDFESEWREIAKNEPKIFLIKNVSNHGNIGYNKHLIAMACDGDYLVEVDHDDELTPDCLEYLYAAFQQYPDAKFAYSDTLELVGDHMSISYGKDFSCGQGFYRIENIGGWNYKVAITCPSINARSIRSIHAQPNHVRAWEKNFYHRIGGHCKELSICDDMDILVRTFLNTKMIHINKVLYTQYEYNRGKKTNTNTQTLRFNAIQALNLALKEKYDSQIHQRILELGFKDTAWDEEKKRSVIDKGNFEIIDYGYQISK